MVSSSTSGTLPGGRKRSANSSPLGSRWLTRRLDSAPRVQLVHFPGDLRSCLAAQKVVGDDQIGRVLLKDSRPASPDGATKTSHPEVPSSDIIVVDTQDEPEYLRA